MLGAALLHAIRPERRSKPLLLSLGVVALGSGCLGFSVGVINTLRFVKDVPPLERHTTTLIGLAESSNNVVLALMAIVLSALLTAEGGLRVTWTKTP